jgi:hypothetical protein
MVVSMTGTCCWADSVIVSELKVVISTPLGVEPHCLGDAVDRGLTNATVG